MSDIAFAPARRGAVVLLAAIALVVALLVAALVAVESELPPPRDLESEILGTGE